MRRRRERGVPSKKERVSLEMVESPLVIGVIYSMVPMRLENSNKEGMGEKEDEGGERCELLPVAGRAVAVLRAIVEVLQLHARESRAVEELLSEGLDSRGGHAVEGPGGSRRPSASEGNGRTELNDQRARVDDQENKPQ